MTRELNRTSMTATSTLTFLTPRQDTKCLAEVTQYYTTLYLGIGAINVDVLSKKEYRWLDVK